MARKFGPRQLKREPSPSFWPIKRKKMAWAPLTRPGPHARDKSLPLVIVIREILGYAKTAR
ncbi:MAG TPA: 30S ribosomal protein S4e, partial [Candidatus Dormibacteraeota bacterium]|nr:30S ribosomal protein S4e [Candidatus Dormibacteraeota bacterium]